MRLEATGDETGAAPPVRLIPLTCPELVRLLRSLALPAPVRDRDHVLHWLAWRRRHHQTQATACHQQRHRLQDTP